MLRRDDVRYWNNWEARRWERCAKIAQAALRDCPHDDVALLRLGQALVKCRQFKRARLVLERFTRLRSDVVGGWFWLSDTLEELGCYDEALTAIRRAIKLDPERDYLWGQQTMILQDMERWKEALISQQRELQLDPRYTHGWKARAVYLRKLGRTRESREGWRRALRLERAIKAAAR